MSSPHVSRAALAAGVPARFLYWSGHSGRRYLFTATSAEMLHDFEDGVALAVNGDRVVWVGDAPTLARFPADSAPRRAAIYVHLLAATAEDRRRIVEDLRPAERPFLRLAA